MIRARYLIGFLLVFCTCKSWAQYTIVPSWGGGADQQDLSFGFTFQYVNSDFKIVKNPNWQKPYGTSNENPFSYPKALTSISSASVPGFGIGFVTRYSFTEHFEVRTTPQLVFSDKSIAYKYDDDKSISKTVSTTSVDVPLSVKFKSDRIGDFRMYLIGGVKTSFSISKRPDEDNIALDDRKVKMSRNYNAWEAGFGCDIYFEYFKLSPEIKFANSFNNVLVAEPGTATKPANPFTSPISKLFLHTISFSLYFE